MTPHVTVELRKEEVSEFHSTLLTECLADMKRSRGVMSGYYSNWDLQDEVYRGERQLDSDDVKQAQRDKPVKMIVPNTFAQVMTFTSFLFLLFKQNTNMFELTPSGSEDFGTKWRDCETVLQRDWSRSDGSRVLFQHLLDVARFGTAPLETCWTKETKQIYVVPEAPMQSSLDGVSLSTPLAGGYQKFTTFEGNRVRAVSPYRWFPDTTFPICEHHRGDFCASEEDWTMTGLRQLEADGEVAGVDYITEGPRNFLAANGPRGGPTRTSFFNWPSTWSSNSGPVVLTKLRKRIVPKKFMVDEKNSLGPEEFPVLYNIWIANDSRIIKCEPAAEWHQQLGFAVAQFTPDMHRTVTLGLADLVYRLQDVISWFVNSHITSVRRVMANRNVINPAFIEMKSYDGEGDIFVRKGVGRIDPRMAVSQLPASDVTAGHMGDVEMLNRIMQIVTGVNDNFMGQMNSGRRSAQENRVQTAGAAGRMKMHGHLIWESGLGKTGKMMLSNSRQSLSLESFAWAIGKGQDERKFLERYSLFKGAPDEIVCGDDYLTFDAVMSSEKGFMAQQLGELLGLLIQADPAAAQQITSKVDPVKLVSEMQYLRDGTPIERFDYTPEERQQMQAQRAQAQQEQQAALQQQAMQAQVQQEQGRQQLELERAKGVQTLQQKEELHQQTLRQKKQLTNGNGSRK